MECWQKILDIFNIEGFSDLPKFLEEPLNNILSYLENTKGIVIDARGGYGGEDIAGRVVIQNKKQDVLLGEDRALEKAIDILQ